MLTPNQIKTQTFSPAGRGAYRASDVDAFMQQIYVSFAEMTSENASMKKKFASLSSIIDEYNAGKNAIATALVKAQAVADETLRTANNEAQSTVDNAKEEAAALLESSKQKAEQYARETKEKADAYFLKAQNELARVVHETQEQSADFVKEINAQAASLIADANKKAAAIVSAAYKDAKVAKEKTKEIVERAGVEIETTRNAVSAFKEAALETLSQLFPLLESMDPDSFGAGDLALSDEIPALEPLQAEAPEFKLVGVFDNDDSEAAEEAPVEETQPEEVIEPEEAVEPEEAAEPDITDGDAALEPDEDDVIAKISSILNDDDLSFYKQESLFGNAQQEVIAPAFEEIDPPQETEDEPEEVQIPFDEDEEEAYDDDADADVDDDDDDDLFGSVDEPEVSDEFYVDDVLADADDKDEEAADEADDEDDAPLAYINYDAADDEDDEEEEPATPFKFRLTKNFNILDDDDDSLDND